MKNICLTISLFLFTFCLKAQNVAADIDSIVRSIHSNYPEIPGMVIGVHHPDHGQFILPFGIEKLGENNPIDTNAIFEVGSINKNFMWVLLHLLHQQEMIDIYQPYYYENPIGNQVYINQLQDSIQHYRGRRFTIADLMKHTTGMVDIPSSNNYPHFIINNLFKEHTLQDALAFLFNTNASSNECGAVQSGMCIEFEMGIDHQYSSYGPTIAAFIAEIETGSNVRLLQKEMIIDRLGMSGTSQIGYENANGFLTYGHDNIRDTNGIFTADYEVLEWYDEQQNLGWYPYSVASLFRFPIFSNAADLLTYLRAQFTDENFISASTLTAMKEEFVLWFNVFRSGLGIVNYEFLWSTNDAEDDFFGHSGDGTFGHGTTIAHRSRDQLSIVVLTNARPSTSPYENFPHFDITKAIGAYFND
jgi:CubicO group peptidase (beta-lactamase class C family)